MFLIPFVSSLSFCSSLLQTIEFLLWEDSIVMNIGSLFRSLF